MSKPGFTFGPAAGLLLVLGTLGACDQTHLSDNAGSARQNAHQAHSTTARVAKHAERAARDVTASVTAVAKGVERGVQEGVRQGQRDARSQQAYNDRQAYRGGAQDSSAPPRTGRPPND